MILLHLSFVDSRHCNSLHTLSFVAFHFLSFAGQALEIPTQFGRPYYSFSALPSELLELSKFFLRSSWCTLGVLEVGVNRTKGIDATEAAKSISSVDQNLMILVGGDNEDVEEAFDSTRPAYHLHYGGRGGSVSAMHCRFKLPDVFRQSSLTLS